ncbi:MAG TPA: hypothetical protein VEB19_17120 [Gemmatimonadaceae bacterium]|nr:hypothetical protein [Gemmatimonadaceae bacterium]
MTTRKLLLLAVPVLTADVALAQGHPHPTGKLGTVRFETSCAPSVSAKFDRAMALLHSFEFGPSIREFESVVAADSTCAMAWWGIALSRWTNPMTPNVRPGPVLERGRLAVESGNRAATRATERERAYLAAVAQLYADHTQRDQRTRILAYERAMAALAEKFPSDMEARIFHALSLVASALPTDKTYANQLKAGAMLEEMWANQPDHPGLAHYIIHSYDLPALADRAAAAARRYADIAPAAAHALHMPSHTFTRVGLWDESVATNHRSMEAAVRDSSPAEALHALDYAMYANMQMRRDSAARAILTALPAIVTRFDPDRITGAAPGSAGLFAIAAIPARYALERRDWNAAAALAPRVTPFPYTEGLTYFARALGAAHTDDRPRAQAAIDSLSSIHARLLASRESYWAEQVAIQHLAAEAWLQFTRGERQPALAKMREAARREEATEKAAVSPGPLVPARELLGDMLLASNRAAEALTEYRKSMQREPNRYLSLAGAARAAEAMGDRSAATGYYRQIEKLTGSPASAQPTRN